MNTFLLKTAASTNYGVTRTAAASRGPAHTLSHNGSRGMATKNHLGALVAAILFAVSCMALWIVNATESPGLVAAPSVQLAAAVTSIEEQGEAQVRPLSGPPLPLEPASSASQHNAVRSAQNYLDYSAFSRKGLIEQLEYEGFSIEDATFAVDQISVDWNEQAAKAAKAYLDHSGFSRSGLIEQLEYEGYTAAQAAYGATAAGL